MLCVSIYLLCIQYTVSYCLCCLCCVYGSVLDIFLYCIVLSHKLRRFLFRIHIAIFTTMKYTLRRCWLVGLFQESHWKFPLFLTLTKSGAFVNSSSSPVKTKIVEVMTMTTVTLHHPPYIVMTRYITIFYCSPRVDTFTALNTGTTLQ